jgi:hypothetical protein
VLLLLFRKHSSAKTHLSLEEREHYGRIGANGRIKYECVDRVYLAQDRGSGAGASYKKVSETSGSIKYWNSLISWTTIGFSR